MRMGYALATVAKLKLLHCSGKHAGESYDGLFRPCLFLIAKPPIAYLASLMTMVRLKIFNLFVLHLQVDEISCRPSPRVFCNL